MTAKRAVADHVYLQLYLQRAAATTTTLKVTILRLKAANGSRATSSIRNTGQRPGLRGQARRCDRKRCYRGDPRPRDGEGGGARDNAATLADVCQSMPAADKLGVAAPLPAGCLGLCDQPMASCGWRDVVLCLLPQEPAEAREMVLEGAGGLTRVRYRGTSRRATTPGSGCVSSRMAICSTRFATARQASSPARSRRSMSGGSSSRQANVSTRM